MPSLAPRIDQLAPNLAINGNMDFFQRASSTAVNAGSKYVADRFILQNSLATTTLTAAPSTDVPPLSFGTQSLSSLLITNGTGVSIPSGIIDVQYRVEGYDYQRIHGRYARFQQVVKTSVAGVYSLSLSNAVQTRSYATTVALAANTWTLVSFDINLDTIGAWNFDNTIGLIVFWVLASGSNFQTSTLNSWQGSGSGLSGAAQVNWAATTGATFQISQYGIVPHDLTQAGAANAVIPFQRAGRTLGHELAMAQRYCFNPFLGGPASQPHLGSGMAFSTTSARVIMPIPVTMRTSGYNLGYSAFGDFVLLTSNGAPTTVTSIAIDSSSASMAAMNYATASGLVAGNGVLVRASSTANLYLDAEL